MCPYLDEKLYYEKLCKSFSGTVLTNKSFIATISSLFIFNKAFEIDLTSTLVMQKRKTLPTIFRLQISELVPVTRPL